MHLWDQTCFPPKHLIPPGVGAGAGSGPGWGGPNCFQCFAIIFDSLPMPCPQAVDPRQTTHSNDTLGSDGGSGATYADIKDDGQEDGVRPDAAQRTPHKPVAERTAQKEAVHLADPPRVCVDDCQPGPCKPSPSAPRFRPTMSRTSVVLEAQRGGGGGRASYEQRGRGGWDPKVRVPKMARSEPPPPPRSKKGSIDGPPKILPRLTPGPRR